MAANQEDKDAKFENMLLLQKTHKERLQSCEEDLAKFQTYLKDYESLHLRLLSFSDKTSYEAMVPIGKMAYMPGRLIHTNEIMVLLGENWFAERSSKQASDIVARRIAECKEKIKELERFKKLHENWVNETSKLDLINAKDGEVDILEEVSEEEYKKQKETHKEMLQRYYADLRETKNKPSDSQPGNAEKSSFPENYDHTKSFEDIMRRLDELEWKEEHYGELDSEDEHSSDSKTKRPATLKVDSDSEATDSRKQSFQSNKTLSLGASNNEEETIEGEKVRVKRRVSWADQGITYAMEDEEDPLVGKISYSSEAPADRSPDNLKQDLGITSPADLYNTFGDSQPKRSILKNKCDESVVSQTPNGEEGSNWSLDNLDIQDDEDYENRIPLSESPAERQLMKPAFTYQVVAHEDEASKLPAQNEEPQPEAKVSRFKASRMKK